MIIAIWIVGGIASAFLFVPLSAKVKPSFDFRWSPRSIFWAIFIGAVAAPIVAFALVMVTIAWLYDRIDETKFGRWWKRPLGKSHEE
jgi:hypothetical protein